VSHLFQGGRGQRKKTPKNSTFKPLSTLFVPCMKIQGGPRPLAADAHASYSMSQAQAQYIGQSFDISKKFKHSPFYYLKIGKCLSFQIFKIFLVKYSVCATVKLSSLIIQSTQYAKIQPPTIQHGRLPPLSSTEINATSVRCTLHNLWWKIEWRASDSISFYLNKSSAKRWTFRTSNYSALELNIVRNIVQKSFLLSIFNSTCRRTSKYGQP